MNEPRPALPCAVKAAVGILVVRNGLILLGRRKGSHGAGTWSAPGGRMEYGETIEQAARRELHEETALELNAASVGPYTNDVFDDVQEHYLTFIVIARATTGEPRIMEPQKCEGWTCPGGTICPSLCFSRSPICANWASRLSRDNRRAFVPRGAVPIIRPQ